MIATDELLALKLKLAERERLLRSLACALDAMSCGVFRDQREEFCGHLARRIRDIVDPERGKAAGRR